MSTSYLVCLFHRACAAVLALALRSLAVILAARALPPFSPPIRPSMTAKGFLPSGVSGILPEAIASIIEWAS